MLSTLRPWLLTLACAALLLVRVGGFHLHLCFDGGEPPVSLHATDGGIHHSGPEAAATHHDIELSLAADALNKLDKLRVNLPVLLLAAVLLLGLQFVRGPAPRRYVFRFVPALAGLLRPPLRGPPPHPSL